MRILQKLQPALINELATELNKHIDPEKAVASTRVWWRCKDAKCDHHVWEARIHDRAVKNSGCPFCTGKKVCSCNSIVTLYPKIAAQWHPTKNTILSTEVTHSSRKRVWWLCPNSKCHHVHEWETDVGSRIKGTGCPWCSEGGRMKRVCECNGLAQRFPKLAREWITHLNTQDPSEVLPGSNCNIWWKCSYCSHEYQRTIMDRTRTDKQSVCPQCKDVVEEKDGKYVLNTIDKYSVVKLKDILRKHNIPGRSSKDKAKLYGLVLELYKNLNEDDKINDVKVPENLLVNNNEKLDNPEAGIDEKLSDCPPSLDECKNAYERLDEYTLGQCQEIARKLGITEVNDRNILCRQIRIKLQERFDSTDEKVREPKSNRGTDRTVEIELIKSSGEKWMISVRNDGLIDLTDLAKAFGYRLDHYFASEKTKAFIGVMSSLPRFRGTKLVEIMGVGKTKHTFVHRLVAYHYAQYIDPGFCVQICCWLDNLFLTGTVTLGKEKSSEELDQILKMEYEKAKLLLMEKDETISKKNREISEKDEKIEIQTKSVVKLQTRIEKLKMKRHHPDLEEGYCLYCHHNGESINVNRFKIGKTKDVNEVLRQARRNAPYTLIDFIMYIPEENYSLIEDSMKAKFLAQRKPRPHEIINSPLKDIIDGATSICNLLNIQYRFAEQSIIDSYNQFIIAETSAGEDVGTQADDEGPDEPQEIDDTKQTPTVINNIDRSTNDNSTTNNTTNNNISVNVNVNLSELKQLLKEIKTFTCKKLDSLLVTYNISKHGNKERKIEKLLNYINTMISDAQNLKDNCEKAKDT